MFKTKRFKVMLAVAAGLLLIPLLGMQFSNEVKWTAADFVVGGVLSFGTATAIELVLFKVRKPAYRIALCASVLVLLVLVWLELAVGIFGTPFSGS